MINIREIHQQLIEFIPTNHLVIAYSGGLDSHVLLHVLSQLPELDKKIRAIHVNHGLQESSKHWSEHCQKICESLGVKLEVISLNLKISKGQSLEEVARKERYLALHQSLKENESLLTAHHQNDQAETFLLQLFRGAGVEGLSSMPVSRLFGPIASERQLMRPLLPYSRESLENYAQQYQLEVVDDPSNFDEAFDRNYLRQCILPQIRSRWLGIDKSIARAALIQSESREILNDVAKSELRDIYDTKKQALSILKLRQLPKAKQKLVLRYWIATSGFSYPSEKKLRHIFSDVIEANKDTQPLLEWQGVELRRYQDYLYISEPLLMHDAQMEISWDGCSPLSIDSLNVVIDPIVLPQDSTRFVVKFRQGGEKIRLPKRGNLSLKNIFQEEGVPPWIRDRLPLIFEGDNLLRVIGLDLDY